MTENELSTESGGEVELNLPEGVPRGYRRAARESTLAIAVVGTLLAVFVADLLSHLTVHSALPTAAEFRHMTAIGAGSITVLVLPLFFGA